MLDKRQLNDEKKISIVTMSLLMKKFKDVKKNLLDIFKKYERNFLDTETTGLSFKDGHKIVEIACIETKD